MRSLTKYIMKMLVVHLRELIQELEDDLEPFYKHESTSIWWRIKNLNNNEKEAIILMDLSKNYYQLLWWDTYNFGGSRLHLSLQTVQCNMGKFETNFLFFVAGYI